MIQTSLTGLIRLDYEVSLRIEVLEQKIIRSRFQLVLMIMLTICCCLLTMALTKEVNALASSVWMIGFAAAVILVIAVKAFVVSRRINKEIRMEEYFHAKIAKHIISNPNPLTDIFKEKMSLRLTPNQENI